MNDSSSIPWELAYALRVLLDEGLGENVYHVRDDELKGWEGPRVVAYGNACTVAEQYAVPADATRTPPTPEEQEIAKLQAEKEEIDARIAQLRGAP